MPQSDGEATEAQVCPSPGSPDRPGEAAGVIEFGAEVLVCFSGASGGPRPGLPTPRLSFREVGSKSR